MKCFAFDVDETLEISAGPITFAMLEALRQEGHIVGLCGNWGLITRNVPGWHMLFSFVNAGVDKVVFLKQLSMYVTADEFIMVGNRLGVTGASDDEGAAQKAGWRFILERDFAQGVR